MNVSTSLGGVSSPSQWVGGVGHTPCVDGIFKLSLKCANSILKLSVMLIFGVILDLEGVANKWVWLKRKFWYVSLYALNRLYQILTFFVNKIPGQNHVNFCCLTFFKSFLIEMDFIYLIFLSKQIVFSQKVQAFLWKRLLSHGCLQKHKVLCHFLIWYLFVFLWTIVIVYYAIILQYLGHWL